MHPPSDITDMVFTKALQEMNRQVTKSNPSLCTYYYFDASQTVSRIRGDPITIAGVVVVRTPVGVHIAEVRRVRRINGTQPPIRRVFYQDATYISISK